MARALQLGTAVRHRLIFELRYERGELYWDRCGRIARTLAATKGWALQSRDGNACHIWDEDRNLVFSYSPRKLDLTQCQNQEVSDLLTPGEFAAVAEEFSNIAVHVLEVDTFPRIGFRLWTLYDTGSVEDASSRVSSMSFFSPCEALRGLGALSHVSHAAVVARQEHMVRVAVTPFEQDVRLAPSLVAAAKAESHKRSKDQDKLLIQKMKAQKAIKAYPAAGVMVDLDAYIEDVPYPEQVSPIGFVGEAMKDFEIICGAILSEEDQR